MYENHQAYNKLLRDRLSNPEHYERMVKLLLDYNPAMENNPNTALNTINECIEGCGHSGDYAIGCCVAYRYGYCGSVRIFLEPLISLDTYFVV